MNTYRYPMDEPEGTIASAPLNVSDVRMLKWAVDQAASWRGALTGNPDPEPLAAFDSHVAAAKAALRKLNGVLARQRAGRGAE